MRLTALRQPRNDISRRINSGHPKATPDPQNDPFPQSPCDCKYISADTKKCGSAEPRDTPYNGAAQAPRQPVFPNSLPDPPILHAWTCKNHQSHNTKINKFSPQVSSHTYTHQSTRTSRLRRPGSGMRPRNGGRADERPLPLRAPNIPERPHPSHSLCRNLYTPSSRFCDLQTPQHSITSQKH